MTSKKVNQNSEEKEEKDETLLTPARLSLLISNVGMRALRLLFRERYRALHKTEPVNGELKMSLSDQVLEECDSYSDYMRKHERAFLNAGSDFSEWDFEFLFHILTFGMGTGQEVGAVLDVYTGPRPPNRKDTLEKQKLEGEKEALKVLGKIRSSLSRSLPGHNSLPVGDLGQMWDTAKDSLLRLGAHERDIDHIRTCEILEDNSQEQMSTKAAGADKDKNESKSKALRAAAEKLVAAGQFEKVMQLYAEALLFSGLSSREKSSLHSSRSKALLTQLEELKDSKSAEDAAVRIMNTAMEDARLVIQLEPKSWKGYFLEGKVFQLWKLFKEAIDSFEVALTRNPSSEEIAEARSECRLELSDIESLIISDPVFIPTRLSEIIKSRQEIQRLVKAHEKRMSSRDPAERARGFLFMGHRHQLGDEASLDPVRATELFLKGADEGSAECAFYAGLNILRGIGTKRNLSIAVSLIDGAANHYSAEVGSKNLLLHKVVTAKAKTLLAMLYENGVGKDRDYGQAGYWYGRAALSGCSTGAMCLATMCSNGRGVEPTIKGALQYQKLAVELGSGGDSVGLHFLGRLYAEIGDLPRARYWLGRAINSGYKAPLLEAQELEQLLQYKEEQFEGLKKKLPAHVLSSKVPIHTLHERYLKRVKPAPAWPLARELKEELRRCQISSSTFREPIRGEPKPAEVRRFAANGQEYARLLLKALESINKFLSSPSGLINDDNSSEIAGNLEKNKKLLALTEMAACFKAGIDPAAASMSTGCRSKLMKVALEFIGDGGRSDSDLAARVCRLNLLKGFTHEALLKFAKDCQLLYPEEAHFHERHSYVLGLLEKHEEGVKVAEEAMKMFPDNWQLLYTRARHLSQLMESNPREGVKEQGNKMNCSRGALLEDSGREGANGKPTPPPPPQPHDARFNDQVEAYREFISKAPTGHPNIPEAHYRLANLYRLSENGSNELRDEFHAGVVAEEGLLSHFLPYESSAKETAEQGLKKLIELGIRFSAFSKLVLDHLEKAEDEEVQETRRDQLEHPKRTLIVQDHRRRIEYGLGVDHGDESRILTEAGFIRLSRPALAGQQEKEQEKCIIPGGIPSLTSSSSSINFEDMDPTIDQVHRGRVINLTIVEELLEGGLGPMQTIVKDDNDDFNLIHFYNFDRCDPATTVKKLGFGSRIRLMSPYLCLSGGPTAVLRVDDPSSVLSLSSGAENPMCRYCFQPNPRSTCSKCKTAQYCGRDCQRVDWNNLGHKTICKLLHQRQKT